MPHDLYSHMIETWRQIPGYEGIYSVSDHGRVRRDKGGHGARAGHLLKPQLHGTNHNYRRVTLYFDGDRFPVLLHTLVAMAFIGPRPEDHQINHLNGNPSDNRSENLEYVTSGENIRHAVEVLGKLSKKLTVEDVLTIRLLLKRGEKGITLATKFNVTRSIISEIKHRKVWKHVA